MTDNEIATIIVHTAFQIQDAEGQCNIEGSQVL
jgi:hypothetical protein